MIFWIVMLGVACFMFGYGLCTWRSKDDKQDIRQEYKITTYSENLDHLVFNKALRREDTFNMDSDLIERIVSMDISNQIIPYIKDKMISDYDPESRVAIYKFDLWVRR